MAGHCVVGCLLSQQKRQNGALLNDVTDDGDEKDCGHVAVGAISALLKIEIGIERTSHSCEMV